ncbi:hypothetical protein ACO2Q8_07675 [Larkinella sp. VNQ87]|uniref:hypothetical protein n=1 Tax=Larkinella sp. VNQ87 TaxID=3400921 RepID=UPI003C1280B3
MAVDFRTRRVNFVPTTGSTNTQTNQKVVFDRSIRRAEAALKSFNLGYTGEDHHVWRQEIEIRNVRIEAGNAVCFDVDFLIRDSSGNIDDRYNGWVDVLVMAETA